MNVVVVTAYGPEKAGGVELSTANLARELLRVGVAISWIYGLPTNGSHSQLRRTCFSILDIAYEKAGIPFPVTGPLGFLRMLRSIRRADAVLIGDAYYQPCLLAVLVARMARRAVVLVQHVGAPAARGKSSAAIYACLERTFVRPALRAASAVVYVSPSVAAHFASVPVKGSWVIGHGVDERFFFRSERETRATSRETMGLPLDQKVNLYAGRFTETKGLATLRELATVRPDELFVFAGDGPIRPEGWGLPNVQCLGVLDPASLGNAMRSADRFLLPSPSESYSLVVREALACGLPVYCGETVVSADPSIAPHVTAVPLRQGHAAENARALFAKLDQVPPDRAAAAAYVRQTCSWGRVASAYLNVLETALRHRMLSANEARA